LVGRGNFSPPPTSYPASAGLIGCNFGNTVRLTTLAVSTCGFCPCRPCIGSSFWHYINVKQMWNFASPLPFLTARSTCTKKVTEMRLLNLISEPTSTILTKGTAEHARRITIACRQRWQPRNAEKTSNGNNAKTSLGQLSEESRKSTCKLNHNSSEYRASSSLRTQENTKESNTRPQRKKRTNPYLNDFLT